MSELPEAVVTAAERLTRLRLRSPDEAEQQRYQKQRAALLSEYGYTARIRSDGSTRTLVCYPQEWLVDGTVRPDRIDDIDRAVERPIAGPGDPDDWETIEQYNQRIVDRVRDIYGDPHHANVAALAAFASDHYAKPIDALSAAERREFREEYYVRNVWPDDQQRAVLADSIAIADEIAAQLDSPSN